MLAIASAILLSSFSFILINAEESESEKIYFIPVEHQSAYQYFISAGYQYEKIENTYIEQTVNFDSVEIISGTDKVSGTINSNGTISAKLNVGAVRQNGTLSLTLLSQKGTATNMGCYMSSNQHWFCGAEYGNGVSGATPPVYGAISGSGTNFNTYLSGTISENGNLILNSTENSTITVSEKSDGTTTGTITASIKTKYKYDLPSFKFQNKKDSAFNPNAWIYTYKQPIYVSCLLDFTELVLIKDIRANIYWNNNNNQVDNIRGKAVKIVSGGYIYTWEIDPLTVYDQQGSFTFSFDFSDDVASKISAFTPLYIGNKTGCPDDLARLIFDSSITDKILTTGDDVTQQQVSTNDVTNQAFDAQMQEYNQIESGHLDSFQTNISKISPSSYGFDKFGTDISKTANFVKVNFEKLIDNQFGNLLGFSLILGLALLMLGRRL